MSVVTLAWDDVADAARWLLDVALTTRDEVEVAMEDGLPCDLALVYPDVEPFHTRIRLLNGFLLLLEEPVSGVELRTA
jgi:hypothetical protein